MLSGNPPSDADFRSGAYSLTVEQQKGVRRRGSKAPPERSVAAILSREGMVNGVPLRVTKSVALGSKSQFTAEYTVELAAGDGFDGYFAIEMNYTFLAGNAHDRFFFHEHSENAGKLSTVADFGTVSFVGMKDQWLKAGLKLNTSVPAQVLVSPVQTVSQSEGGFEAVYQSSCIVLQWPLKLAGSKKSFSVVLQQECGRD
jgi:Domain of unknown function (DUF1926)